MPVVRSSAHWHAATLTLAHYGISLSDALPFYCWLITVIRYSSSVVFVPSVWRASRCPLETLAPPNNRYGILLRAGVATELELLIGCVFRFAGVTNQE